jgi:hypothetical protein
MIAKTKYIKKYMLNYIQDTRDKISIIFDSVVYGQAAAWASPWSASARSAWDISIVFNDWADTKITE